MPPLFNDPAFIIAAVVAVVLVGLAKGGFSGLGALATPIMALAISPVVAAASVLFFARAWGVSWHGYSVATVAVAARCLLWQIPISIPS